MASHEAGAFEWKNGINFYEETLNRSKLDMCDSKLDMYQFLRGTHEFYKMVEISTGNTSEISTENPRMCSKMR